MVATSPLVQNLAVMTPNVAPTSPLVQTIIAKAHEASSLAVASWNDSFDAQLPPFHHAVSKIDDAYTWVYAAHWDRLQSAAIESWRSSAPVVLALLAKALPMLRAALPFLLLSAPIVTYVIYQLYFHPLAKYPGPLLGRITGARSAYHTLRGDLYYDMWACHQKYGPYVRYKPNYLLFDTTQACKDIYGHNKNMQKSKPYLAMVHGVPSTFTLTNKKEHAWKKRILSQKFSDSAIRSYEGGILKLVDRFCEVMCPKPNQKSKIDRLVCNALCSQPSEQTARSTSEEQGSWSQPFDMSTWCDNLFFDLMTSTVFGESFDLLRSQWYRHIPEALARSNIRISVLVQWPVLVWQRLDKLLFKDSVHGRKEFLRFVHNLVTDRMTKGSHKGDIFSRLMDASDPATGNQLSRDEIVAESILMIVAGSDTSSTMLSSMFFYLARNPEKKAKVVKEVRSVFGSRDEVRLGAKLSSCRYLQACISECLRMAPPVASSPFREVGAGGAIVDGQYLPEGSNIGTGIYSIQHNENYFPEPFKFMPERWLQDENPYKVNVTEAYLPFSIGPRACLGRSLAVAEGTLATAYICWMMDFSIVESMKHIGGGRVGSRPGRNRPEEYQMYDHITSARKGPWIQFRRRTFEC